MLLGTRGIGPEGGSDMKYEEAIAEGLWLVRYRPGRTLQLHIEKELRRG